MRFQQSLSFNKSLSLNQIIKILVDPVLMIAMLFFFALMDEGRLGSHYIVLSIMVFALSFPGTWGNAQSLSKDVMATLSQWFLVVGILLFFGYATAYLPMFSQQVVIAWVLITPVILIIMHWLISRYFVSKHYLTHIKKTAVVVGQNELCQQLCSRIKDSNQLAIEVKGYFDDLSVTRSSTFVPDNQQVAHISEIASFVKQQAIDIIYITLPPSMHIQIMALLDDLKDTTASIYFVPDFFMADLIQGRIDEIDGMPVVAVCETPFTGFNGIVKRLSDIVIASIILCVISPLILIVAIGVKFSSPGPILFKQRRYGLDGQEIIVYKFRSMKVTEDGATVTQATLNDKRVTPFGQFIRKTSLDELPQFFNVLQGRMSIVGPRPHAVTHNEIYRKLIKGYMVRHKVKPGITGWAQVNGYRGETKTIESMKNRIDYDLEYLKKWSLSLDIRIILKTILLVFKDSKAY
ncbi:MULTISPECIES: undecaprenyl-phosphate glucose phosphotransferase [Methylotenera]|uniref:undecaprenyl-phosphate glucose phosphotransferase n=1 Tax=Methylotenera TaxID=359407 RepID=UPI00036791FA|nr:MULTISPECIES: undecaprenyl-phosphate glucose phosphotransferase [Methylotenera]